ncbi:MAG: hypothetical protein AMS19_03060 [Gemmatimonas sp. SG8_23]|nr:MAG: hypothetical protein AMS19_03060 [Gemmatimonas sp. SG8_23]
MNDVTRSAGLRSFLLACGLLLIPDPVFAYVGPGAGLTAIGAALALVGGILLGVFGFVWYPIKRLLLRFSSGSDHS